MAMLKRTVIKMAQSTAGNARKSEPGRAHYAPCPADWKQQMRTPHHWDAETAEHALRTWWTVYYGLAADGRSLYACEPWAHVPDSMSEPREQDLPDILSGAPEWFDRATAQRSNVCDGIWYDTMAAEPE